MRVALAHPPLAILERALQVVFDRVWRVVVGDAADYACLYGECELREIFGESERAVDGWS